VPLAADRISVVFELFVDCDREGGDAIQPLADKRVARQPQVMHIKVPINRASQQTEPALRSPGPYPRMVGVFTLKLRHGLRSPMAALRCDDVLFSFKLYLDEKIHSPQRDLLVSAESD